MKQCSPSARLKWTISSSWIFVAAVIVRLEQARSSGNYVFSQGIIATLARIILEYALSYKMGTILGLKASKFCYFALGICLNWAYSAQPLPNKLNL